MFNRFSFCFYLFFSLINARHQICHSSFLRVHSNSFHLFFFLCSASPLKVTIAKRDTILTRALLTSSATNKTVRDIGQLQISPLIQSGVQAFSQAPLVCHFGLKFIRFYLGCGFLLIASAGSWRNVACEMNTVLGKAHR